MVRCKVITSSKQNPLIGAYLSPYTLEHLPDLDEDLTRFSVQDPIVVGDINADIRQVQNPCIQKVSDLLIEFGMLYLLRYFRQNW